MTTNGSPPRSVIVGNSFSNSAGCITKEDVARVRAETKERAVSQPWTEAELLAAAPPSLKNAAGWKDSASHGAESLAALTDGNPGTSWSSVKAENTQMHLEVELPAGILLGGITLDSKASGRPRLLTITTSSDGKSWDAPVFEGPASSALSDLTFKPATASFIRIVNKGNSHHQAPWVIHELRLHAY